MSHPQKIAILAYHSLDESDSVLSTSPRLFREHMRLLSEFDVDVVSLNQLRHRLNQAGPCKPMVAITFDDGFGNVYEHGLPILQHYGLPATVFLVTDYCGKSNSWPSQLTGIMREPLLKWDAIKEMSRAGIIFGSHTRTHPDLTVISTGEAEEEMVSSKNAIEDAIGCPVETFAYPYGAYSNAVRQLATTHFKLACSVALGFVRSASDLFALERLDMYYLRRPGLFRDLFSRKMDLYIRLRRLARGLRRPMSALPLEKP